MFKSIGVIELKNVPKGVEATDDALKSAGVEMVSAHPSCPGKYEIILTATCIKAADIAVKTARVEIFDLRVSRGLGGKGVVIITGEIGDVTAAVEAGANYAKGAGMLSATSVIAAPHEELWNQI